MASRVANACLSGKAPKIIVELPPIGALGLNARIWMEVDDGGAPVSFEDGGLDSTQ